MKNIVFSLKKLLFKKLPIVSGIGMFALVSCYNTKSDINYSILPTYTSQADVLISLGIQPDYYPVQTKPVSQGQLPKYLVNADQFISDKNPNKTQLQAQIKKLANVKEKGIGWWDEHTAKEENDDPSNQYWTTKKANVLLYDTLVGETEASGFNVQRLNNGPTARFVIQTDYRTARDPYTIYPKEIFELAAKAVEWKNDINNSTKKKAFTDLFEKYNVSTNAPEHEEDHEHKEDEHNHEEGEEELHHDQEDHDQDMVDATVTESTQPFYVQKYANTTNKSDYIAKLFIGLLAKKHTKLVRTPGLETKDLIWTSELEQYLKSKVTSYDEIIKHFHADDHLFGYIQAAQYWFENFYWNKNLKDNSNFLQWIFNNDEQKFQPIFAQDNSYNDQSLAALFQRSLLLTNTLKNEFKQLVGYSQLPYLVKSLKTNITTTPAYSMPSETAETNVVIATQSKHQKHLQTSKQIKQFARLQKNPTLQHHPVFHQTIKGVPASIYSGAIRSEMFFTYDIASQLKNLSTNSVFQTYFQNDPRLSRMQKALEYTDKMSQNYKIRLDNIRKYLQKIKVVDENYNPAENKFTNTNSKSLAIVGLSPSIGNNALFSTGNFPEIFYELGIKQAIPKLTTTSQTSQVQTKIMQNAKRQILLTADDHDHGHDHAGSAEDISKSQTNNNAVSAGQYPNNIEVAGLNDDSKDLLKFNLDFNGWWFNLGKADQAYSQIWNSFKETSDYTLLTGETATVKSNHNILKNFLSFTKQETKNGETKQDLNDDTNIYNAIFQQNSAITKKVGTMWKMNYDLWGYGSYSLLGKNMILDSLLDILANRFSTSNDDQTLLKNAYTWGDYWSNDFLKA